MSYTNKRPAKGKPVLVTKDTEVKYAEVLLTAAEVIASNSTYPTIVPAPGTGKGLVFVGGFQNIYGGSTDYDQDCDTTLNYTDNSGLAVTGAHDDVLNDGTAGSCVPFLPIATGASFNELAEVAVTANAPIVYVNTASPKNAAGDRLVRVGVWYRVIDILT